MGIQREILGLVAERAVESHRFRRRVGDGQGNLDIEMLVDDLIDDFLEILFRLGIVFLNLLLGKLGGMLEGLQGIKLGFVFLVNLVPGLGRYGRLLIEGAVALVHHAPEDLEQVAIRLDIGIGVIGNRFLVGIIVCHTTGKRHPGSGCRQEEGEEASHSTFYIYRGSHILK